MPASTVNSEINFIIILTFKFFLFTQNYVMTFVAHTHCEIKTHSMLQHAQHFKKIITIL